MKTFVINLKRREDRIRVFNQTNDIQYEIFEAVDGSGINYNLLKQNWFDTNKDWIDPLLKTHLTHGEVGCFLSHYYLWVTCLQLNVPLLILEDDAIITDRFSFREIEEVLNKGYNFLYLGWLEMDKSLPIDETFVIPTYPYWTLAYALTPEAASVLVHQDIRNNIIPVDEYLPLKMKELRPCAYRENVIKSWDRSEGGTDIDPTDRYRFFIDFKTHALTVGSDDYRCEKLYESSKKYNFEFLNIGKDVIWNGTDMVGPGGGQKINILREYIHHLPDHDVILFCDGYDVFIANNLEEIVRRYLEFKCKVVFAAEEVCWPNKSLAKYFPKSHTPYRYLNSGLFIGRVDELKRIVKNSITDSDDDQLYYQKAYLSNQFDIQLDFESHIFQCHDKIVYFQDGKLYNPKTNCYSCIYHGNGGEDAKKHFESLYEISNLND
jgi:GR25 family glycosyltransferase involved in LPS biosynthesis